MAFDDVASTTHESLPPGQLRASRAPAGYPAASAGGGPSAVEGGSENDRVCGVAPGPGPCSVSVPSPWTLSLQPGAYTHSLFSST
jgi:hypothetical protein